MNKARRKWLEDILSRLEDIKDELGYSATIGGESYQKKVKENKDLVDDGDQKTVIGLSLIGAGILVLGVGFVISF